MWNLKNNADGRTKSENMMQIRDMCYALKDITPVKRIEVVESFTEHPSAYELVLYAEFDNKKDLNQYLRHPEHLKVVDFLKKVVDQRAIADYLI
jgi:hypothetical protein